MKRDASRPFVRQYLPYLLAQAAERTTLPLHRVLKQQGIRESEWRVLATLFDAGDGMGVSELARHVLVPQSTLSRRLDRMMVSSFDPAVLLQLHHRIPPALARHQGQLGVDGGRLGRGPARRRRHPRGPRLRGLRIRSVHRPVAGVRGSRLPGLPDDPRRQHFAPERGFRKSDAGRARKVR